MTTEKLITSAQTDKVADLGREAVKTAVGKVNPTSTNVQTGIISNGREFKNRVEEAVKAIILEMTTPNNQYANEEVSSIYGYLSGYKPKGITEQTNRLRELFPGIGFADEKIAEGELPKHAEGWFAIPKWQTVAPTYGEAVEKVLAMIKKTRNGEFHNYREGQLGPDRLRQSAKSAHVFQKLGDKQKDHDILVVPAQFGIHHRGRSIRRAREVFAGNESGLGAFAIGIMLLTHPERLQHYEDLWIDCAGDEYAPDADGDFSCAPIFRFSVGQVLFDANWVICAVADYGSVSAFVPQK